MSHELVVCLRKEVKHYHFSFILINSCHFRFGMTIHCTSIKTKLSKNIILNAQI